MVLKFCFDSAGKAGLAGSLELWGAEGKPAPRTLRKSKPRLPSLSKENHNQEERCCSLWAASLIPVSRPGTPSGAQGIGKKVNCDLPFPAFLLMWGGGVALAGLEVAM